MATHPSILVLEIPWTEEPVPGVVKELDMAEWPNNNNKKVYIIQSYYTGQGIVNNKWKWSRSVLSNSLRPRGL